ncbi:uncharacterized protein Gasu_45650 [Galdieria sulphuraria]|uniref:Uncharacterized protein n=1 Tax=Galdieria sulphuraria TaxID=130081 RepID=M2XD85_GALSU|nr:uncharacterized protein Gasu_45650 [Galdieria sulphuraria]EME27902.1 hypothetical protein Gasu_45650 [Galdieria sulphuraria]|eukprot:XP_005704422.1 hypothetical protein Gasu_45650 [Galdieria sulphuraria]
MEMDGVSCFVASLVTSDSAHVNKPLSDVHRNQLHNGGLRSNKARRCHQPRMLLRPMVSVTDFGCYGITEEIEHSLHKITDWGTRSQEDQGIVVDCEPILDKLHISSDSSSSSSNSSAESRKARKLDKYGRLSVLEDSSPIHKKEKRKAAKRLRLGSLNKTLTENRDSPREVPFLWKQTQVTGELSSDSENVQLGVCCDKSCCRNKGWQTVHQVILQRELGRDSALETLPIKCKKLCSKKGFTVTIQGKSFGNMNADSFYQVLSSTWKQGERVHEVMMRPAA